MNVLSRGILTAVLIVFLLAAYSYCSAAPLPVPRQVSAIRFWTAPDHTRIVLDMSSESAYRIRILENPDRIAVDISGGRFAPGIKPVEVNDGVLSRIRVNRLRSIAQVVLDLPAKTKFRHFCLKPYKDRPHRIVIDLERILSRDEIKRERERADQVATSGKFVVIIDPGHGGSQPGACSRSGVSEKDIVLSLSTLMAAEINARAGCKAILTRDGDYDVGLQRRIDIARNYGGDCFVSIHMNSNRSSKPRGSEVYFLSLEGATDENAQAVAERENLFIQMGEQADQINDDLKSILFDLNRRNSMYKSSLLAGEIAASMGKNSILPFRGVKQANFVVLRSITIPSVLVEAAFISSKKDMQIVKNRDAMKQIAADLSSGIIAYLEKFGSVEKQSMERNMITHVVSKGETLWRIARMYGITVAQLKAQNALNEHSSIQPGQKLVVIR